MGARPSVGTYGHAMDISTGDYVECCQCQQRFVGGTFTRRVDRWAVHAEQLGCLTAKARRLQELGP